MFKVGDRLVCISNKLGDDNYYPNFCLDFNKIYVVSSVYYNISIQIEGKELISWSNERFVTLKEYRKQKLKEICSKQEIK